MANHIRFDAPISFVGWIVERLVLARYLRQLIAQRSEFLRDTAEGLR